MIPEGLAGAVIKAVWPYINYLAIETDKGTLHVKPYYLDDNGSETEGAGIEITVDEPEPPV